MRSMRAPDQFVPPLPPPLPPPTPSSPFFCARSAHARRYERLVLFVLICYSPLVQNAATMQRCIDDPDFGWVLASDSRVSCEESLLRGTVRAHAFAVIGIIGVGLPLFVLRTTYKLRESGRLSDSNIYVALYEWYVRECERETGLSGGLSGELPTPPRVKFLRIPPASMRLLRRAKGRERSGRKEGIFFCGGSGQARGLSRETPQSPPPLRLARSHMSSDALVPARSGWWSC